MNNNSFYPEPFFTKTYIQNKQNINSNLNEQINNQNENNSIFSSLFKNINFEQISKLLPLFLNKKQNNSSSMLDIIKNISPNAEKLLSAVSALGLNKNKTHNKNEIPNTKESVIDISSYEETN